MTCMLKYFEYYWKFTDKEWNTHEIKQYIGKVIPAINDRDKF